MVQIKHNSTPHLKDTKDGPYKSVRGLHDFASRAVSCPNPSLEYIMIFLIFLFLLLCIPLCRLPGLPYHFESKQLLLNV